MRNAKQTRVESRKFRFWDSWFGRAFGSVSGLTTGAPQVPRVSSYCFPTFNTSDLEGFF